jgi:transposase
MRHYVGLDVGLEETSLCIVDSEGITVREVKVSTEPEAIRCALEGFADRLDRVGVEASSLGIWLYRELQPAGLAIIVVEARNMRVSLSRMRNKTDRNDAGHCADDATELVPRRPCQEYRHAEKQTGLLR